MEGGDSRVAELVQPNKALKTCQPPLSKLFSGLQQSRCHTFPRTSNEPGPSPPASSTSAPRLRARGSARARAREGGDAQVVERVLLERPDRLAEEPGADEEDEVGHDNKENRDGRSRSECIDQVSTHDTTNEAYDGGDGDSSCSLTERNTTDEDDSFDTFSQDSDQG